MHDPEKREAAQAARSRGAYTTNARRRKLEPLPDFSDMPHPRTLDDVAAWQARVAEALVRGELDPRRGHELTYNLRALKETLEATDSATKAKELLDEVQALKRAQGGRR